MNTASLHGTVYLQTKEKEKEIQWNKKRNKQQNIILKIVSKT